MSISDAVSGAGITFSRASTLCSYSLFVSAAVLANASLSRILPLRYSSAVTYISVLSGRGGNGGTLYIAPASIQSFIVCSSDSPQRLAIYGISIQPFSQRETPILSTAVDTLTTVFTGLTVFFMNISALPLYVLSVLSNFSSERNR